MEGRRDNGSGVVPAAKFQSLTSQDLLKKLTDVNSIVVKSVRQNADPKDLIPGFAEFQLDKKHHSPEIVVESNRELGANRFELSLNDESQMFDQLEKCDSVKCLFFLPRKRADDDLYVAYDFRQCSEEEASVAEEYIVLSREFMLRIRNGRIVERLRYEHFKRKYLRLIECAKSPLMSRMRLWKIMKTWSNTKKKANMAVVRKDIETNELLIDDNFQDIIMFFGRWRRLFHHESIVRLDSLPPMDFNELVLHILDCLKLFASSLSDRFNVICELLATRYRILCWKHGFVTDDFCECNTKPADDLFVNQNRISKIENDQAIDELIDREIRNLRIIKGKFGEQRCDEEKCLEELRRKQKSGEENEYWSEDEVSLQRFNRLLERTVRFFENSLTETLLCLARKSVADLITQFLSRKSDRVRNSINKFFFARTRILLDECEKVDGFVPQSDFDQNKIRKSSKSVLLEKRLTDSPLLKITVSLRDGKLCWDPEKRDFLMLFEATIERIKEIVSDVDSLSYSPFFKLSLRHSLTATGSLQSGKKMILSTKTIESDLEFSTLSTHCLKIAEQSFDGMVRQVDNLRIMEAFARMYDGFDDSVVEPHKTDADWWSEQIKNALLQKVLMAEMNYSVWFGFYLIDLSDLRTSLLAKNEEYFNSLSRLLTDFTLAYCEQLNTSLNDIATRLETPVSDTKGYVDLLISNDKFLETAEIVQDESEIADRLHELVDSFQLHEFNDHEKQIAESIGRNLARCFSASDSCVANRQELRSNAVRLLEDDVRALNELVKAFGLKLYESHLLDETLTKQTGLEALDSLEKQLEQLLNLSATINSQQIAIGMDISGFPELEELSDEYKLIRMLWEMKPEIEKCRAVLMSDVKSIDIERLNKTIAEIERKLILVERKLQPNKAAVDLRAEFKFISDRMPLLICLRNPNLKSHHFEEINKILRCDDQKGRDLTLANLEKMKAFDRTDLIVEVVNSANSEASIEELLDKIEKTWKEMELPVNPKQESILPALLGDVEDINQMVEDSIVNLSAIISSKYVGRFKFRVVKWQSDLIALRDALDALSALQRDYLFLEKIFTSSDIKKQLTSEVLHFSIAENILVDLMGRLNRSPKALELVYAIGIREKLEDGIRSIEIVKAGLSGFLESKRRKFPRFYFISDQELIEIQSNADNPIFMQEYIRKCFDGIHRLTFKANRAGVNYVFGMISSEGENVGLNKFPTSAVVESWLNVLETRMRRAVSDLTLKAVRSMKSNELLKWIELNTHQSILNTSYISWTKEVSEILRAVSPQSLGQYETELSRELSELAKVARLELSDLVRLITRALITIKVHARDIVAGLNRNKVGISLRDLIDEKKVASICDFEWSKQLRYYLNENELNVQIASAGFAYANEYLGCAERLVITPLTDRCYLCLTGAAQVHLGGAPAGPAGTGKTETTKDLAKTLGKPCVVFNCSESMDYKLMGKFFSGMAQSGIWCCFDEFNRIDVEVLSVIAQQLMTIRDAKRSGLDSMIFNGDEIPLVGSCAAFITMNPGYAGRTELPDNLKMLFRPISMMVPDYASIAEVVLYSEGFEQSTVLASKMVLMYRLSSEQLSKQDHYDFGMRAIKSVLVMAGQLKRNDPNESEAIVLIKALYQSNVPKFLSADTDLFKAIVKDLFPTTRIEDERFVELMEALKKAMSLKSMHFSEPFGEKVVQLLNTLGIRHGVMIVGGAGSGKSSVIEMLADTCGWLAQQESRNFLPVKTYHLNPKAITIDELYGCFDKHTLEWKEGLLGKIVKKCVASKQQLDHWIICDGPVDALWIENLNTVLDDNKMLCLPNSDRIKFSDHMKMLFEVLDLRSASPATVSRCGMVYMDERVIGWRSYFARWLTTTLSDLLSADHLKLIKDFFELYVDDALEMACGQNHEFQPQNRFGKVASLCAILESLIRSRKHRSLSSFSEKSFLCNSFAFAYFWSMAGAGNSLDWEEFDIFAKQQFDRSAHIQIPPSAFLFKSFVNEEFGILDQWDDIVEPFGANPQTPVIEMFVPNVDSTRFGKIACLLLRNSFNVLLTGETGTGKSAILKQSTKQLLVEEDFGSVVLNFSAKTESSSFQSALLSKLSRDGRNDMVDKKQEETIKRTIVVIDDLNMPTPDAFGTQSTIELMRQCIDKKGLYQKPKLNWRPLNEIAFSATCGPPGGGRTLLCPRLLRTMTVLNVPQQSEFEMKKMFKMIARRCFLEASPQFYDSLDLVIDVTIEFYLKLIQIFRPTNLKPHYLYNLRDLSRTIQGLCEIPRGELWSREQLLDVMIHESSRVFHDRLLDENDRNLFYRTLESTIFEINRKAIELSKILEKPLIFCDISQHDLGRSGSRYELVLDFEKLKKKLSLIQETFVQNASNKKLILFDSACVNLTRILRIIRMDRGNALVVGMSGVGKRSLVRFACFVYKIKCFEISLSRGYGISDFRQDLKQLYRIAGCDNEHCVLLIGEDQLINEQFLEDLNGFLNNGEIANLWERPGELEQVLITANKTAGDLKPSGDGGDNFERIYEQFMARVRRNLHVVICLSHLSEKFRIRCRTFPSLVTCSFVNFIPEWNDQALRDIAKVFLNEDRELCELEDLTKSLIELSVQFHTTSKEFGNQMVANERRVYFSTSATYMNFLRSFVERKNSRKKSLISDQNRYIDGIGRLHSTNETVKQMNLALSELEPKLKDQQSKSEAMQKEISDQQTKAIQFAGIVSQSKSEAQKKAEEVGITRDDANRELEALKPILAKAARALDSLNKDDIQMVASYANPPNQIKFLMEAICLICGESTDWQSAKRLLNRNRFIDSLKEIGEKIKDKPASLFKQIKVYLDNPKFTPQIMQRSSSACKSLCEWVIALYEYRRVYMKVYPVQQKYDNLQSEYVTAKKDLERKEAELSSIYRKISDLKVKADRTESEKKTINREIDLTKMKLARSRILVDALAMESIRWNERKDELQAFLDNNIGDSFLSCACLAYQGPFPNEYRVKILKQWSEDCDRIGLKFSDGNVLEGHVSDASVFLKWKQNGLPEDGFSTQSGIILQNTQRWPLCLDPQNLAYQWIKNSLNNHRHISHKDPNLLKELELSVRLGSKLLVRDVDGDIDSALTKVIEKSFYQKAGRTLIMIGDNEIQYDPQFELYMFTNQSNPAYTPEHFSKCCVINFEVTLSGLVEQLLSEIIHIESAEVELQRNQLLSERQLLKDQLKRSENDILDLINRSGDSILDNDSVIDSLKSAKARAEQSKAGVSRLARLELEFEEIRLKYRKLAMAGSMIYFALNTLTAIDPMYDWSLQFVRNNFTDVVRQGVSDGLDFDGKLNALGVWEFGEIALILSALENRSLFEKHRQLWAFILCVQFQRLTETIDEEMVEEMLLERNDNGNIESDLIAKLHDLSSRHECFRWLVDEISAQPLLLKISDQTTIRLNPEIQTKSAPKDLSSRFRPLEKLVLIKSLIPNFVREALTDFICSILGSEFAKTSQDDFSSIFARTTPKLPLLIVLCAGSDPMGEFNSLAVSHGMSKKTRIISLGQGQGPIAEKLIESSLLDGQWVFLQNCHLAPSWMDTLEILFNRISSSQSLNPSFRLVLSTMPTKRFPRNILSNSVKIVFEPPKSIRSNSLRCLSLLTAEKIGDEVYNRALAALSLFHSIILDRKKFGSRGFNIRYEFNDSDFDFAVSCLTANYEQPTRRFAWNAIRFVIGEITYGGRVTDCWDQRCLRATLTRILSDERISGSFSSSGIYNVRECSDLARTKHYFENLPRSDETEVFGIHPIMNEIVQKNEALQFLESINLTLLRQANLAKAGESHVLELCNWILQRIPHEPLNVENAPRWLFEKDDQGRVNSLATLLEHEVGRYNRLLQFIEESTRNMIGALNGLVVMDATADLDYSRFLSNRIPESWERISYPTTSSLRGFISDLCDRISFVESWIIHGRPKSYWLPGLYFTQGFLTAVLQIHARRNLVPIDELTFRFNFTSVQIEQSEYVRELLEATDDEIEFEQKLPKIESGVLVHGLFADCFQFCQESRQMAEPSGNSLTYKLPVIHLEPVRLEQAQSQGFYQCPLYRTPQRSGTLSTTGHSTNYVTTVSVPTDKDPDFWTEMGCAMLCQIDE